MLHNKPPGTEIILMIITGLISTAMLFSMIYSWFVMDSQSISFFIFGIMTFIILIYVSFRYFDEGDDNDSSIDSKENFER